MSPRNGLPSRVFLNAFVGFIVGLAGGLVGLGGAELRLPYLAGTLDLPLKTAIPVNLAISLATLLAALPTRLYTLSTASLRPFLFETAALGLGAILGAYAGVSWLRRLSPVALMRAVFALLLALGLVMIAESLVQVAPVGVLPDTMLPRLMSGWALGLVIGAISGLLGVAGGEVIIPTLILGFGAPIKAAGSLSQMVSIPTVLTGFVRHYRAGALRDRAIVRQLIFPMGLGAIAGGIGGGLLSSLASASFLKAVLGVILIASSVKVFVRKHGLEVAPVILALFLTSAASAQTPNCVQPSNQQLIIYRAGSLSRAFAPLEKTFTCQTGIQVKDVAMGSVDAGRQITAGRQACDLYAPADYLDIDLFMKPAGYAAFNIVFAQGRMVLAYSVSGLAEKKLPPIAEPGSPAFRTPDAIPKAVAKWYENLTAPGVVIGGGNPFLDPGAYRAPMIFQLAEAYYKVPNLYNNLLEHIVIPGADPSGTALGKVFDFQFTYEHNARATANTNPDYRYVDLPEEINLSDPAKDVYYRQNAVVAMPGLGTQRSARTIMVPGAHVAWGITMLTGAPNRENAIKFLQLLLSPSGIQALRDNGPTPIAPALVSPGDLRKLPESLRPLVRTTRK